MSAKPSATELPTRLSTTVENLPLNLHINMEDLHLSQSDAALPVVNQQPLPLAPVSLPLV